MTEPQVWTLIGVFAVALFGVLTLMSTMFLRVLRAEIGGLRGEMMARFEGVDRRFDNLEGRMDRLEGRIDRLEGRIERVEGRMADLDRDVQMLVRHTFPEA